MLWSVTTDLRALFDLSVRRSFEFLVCGFWFTVKPETRNLKLETRNYEQETKERHNENTETSNQQFDLCSCAC